MLKILLKVCGALILSFSVFLYLCISAFICIWICIWVLCAWCCNVNLAMLWWRFFFVFLYFCITVSGFVFGFCVFGVVSQFLRCSDEGLMCSAGGMRALDNRWRRSCVFAKWKYRRQVLYFCISLSNTAVYLQSRNTTCNLTMLYKESDQNCISLNWHRDKNREVKC